LQTAVTKRVPTARYYSYPDIMDLNGKLHFVLLNFNAEFSTEHTVTTTELYAKGVYFQVSPRRRGPSFTEVN